MAAQGLLQQSGTSALGLTSAQRSVLQAIEILAQVGRWKNCRQPYGMMRQSMDVWSVISTLPFPSI